MKVTKESILDKAQDLYNQQGYSLVSTRVLCKALEISPGNLTYHFKKQEHLIYALYERLVSQMDEVHNSMNQFSGLNDVMNFTERLFEVISENRYFFADFNIIMRSNKDIASHYKNLVQQRKQQFLIISHLLIEQGILRSEELPEEYSKLHTRLHLFTDNYFNGEILFNTEKETLKTDFLQQVKYMIYPYLKAEHQLTLLRK